MQVIIQSVLNLISQLLPSLGNGATEEVIAAIVKAAIDLLALAIKFDPALVAEVQGIIASLQSTGALTQDQIATLDAANKSADGDFAAAVVADAAGA